MRFKFYVSGISMEFIEPKNVLPVSLSDFEQPAEQNCIEV